MWRIWWARNNASKWQMGFNFAFKGLMWKKFHSRGTGWIFISWRPRTVGRRRLQICTHMLVISISERNLAQHQDHFLFSLKFRGNLWLSAARYWAIFHKYDRNLIEMTLIFKSLGDTLGTDSRNTNVQKKGLYFTVSVCTQGCFWKFNTELFRLKNSLRYRNYISEMGFWMERQTAREK